MVVKGVVKSCGKGGDGGGGCKKGGGNDGGSRDNIGSRKLVIS